MSNHTPGPWTCHYVHNRPIAQEVFGPNERIALAEYLHNDSRHGEQVANARLIAAAPELLAALRSLVYFHDTDDTSAFDNWEQARAAIAKATGQE